MLLVDSAPLGSSRGAECREGGDTDVGEESAGEPGVEPGEVDRGAGEVGKDTEVLGPIPNWQRYTSTTAQHLSERESDE